MDDTGIDAPSWREDRGLHVPLPMPLPMLRRSSMAGLRAAQGQMHASPAYAILRQGEKNDAYNHRKPKEG